ncbi:class I SAM-dependent methyltransferase [Nocardia brasiliensis]|uniref:class I SAM-dependent methyltransferase n=1 Tax=Nocardia brasiliensis TaxID=37326 RepID=UPI0036711D0E
MTTSYAERAALYAIEIAATPVPSSLPELLHPGVSIAELPCGTGHFLPLYRAYRADCWLLDAEPAMLAEAERRCAALGLPVRTNPVLIGRDRPPGHFDVVVCPNAALNYLAAQLGMTGVLRSLLRFTTTEGHLLLQAVLRHPDGRIDPTACYDPRAPHDRWIPEWERPDGNGGTVTRSRWQRRRGDRITVTFARTHNGTELPESTVELVVIDCAEIVRFTEVEGHRLADIGIRDGMTEILLQR